MNLRSRNFLVVVSLVLLLCVGGVGMAVASPDGDDDPGYNANGETGVGTQYSEIGPRFDFVSGSHPVTTQDGSAQGAGSSVTATLLTPGEGSPRIQLVRYDSSGEHVPSFGEDGTSVQFFPEGLSDNFARELLDIRVLSDGTIRVLVRASDDQDDQLWVVDFSANGEVVDVNRDYDAPNTADCREPGVIISRDKIQVAETSYTTTLNAARIAGDGSVSGLWTCYRFEGEPPLLERQTRGQAGSESSAVYVSYYAPGASDETAHRVVDADGENPYGEDLEFGPGDEPFVLTGTLGPGPRSARLGFSTYSQVFHYALGTEGDGPVDFKSTKGGGNTAIVSRDPVGGSDPSALPARPVDLAVDHAGRPLVWTEDDESDSGSDWLVYRLTSSLGTDTSWGTGGKATISEDRLQPADSGNDYYEDVLDSLTVRPDNRVLVTGAGEEPGQAAGRASTRGTTTATTPALENATTSTAIIAGLTSGGVTDTGFGDATTPGFKAFNYSVVVEENRSADFEAVGEPKVQSDGKVLVPHTSTVGRYRASLAAQRIAPPQNDPRDPESHSFVGVTRLRLAPPAGTPGTNGSNPGSTAGRPSVTRPVTPSSTSSQCGRRVISLVRADARGNKIRLTGLVGSKLYGKKVTIETNPTAVKASAYSKTATVKASKTGSFSATVPAPKKSKFKTVRYRAKSGGATSPVLKLPQSLTSRSVKSAKGTITVKGQVKKSVLGKRNSVKIRRLVCGRYRTVAVVKPAADGSYSATFKASKIRGVAFYRAESNVQVKPGSKKYAIQYARAIAIRTTSQTG